MNQSNDLAPGIVEMFDESRQSYLVDKDISHILTNRRIWTDATGTLMIEVAATWTKNMLPPEHLASWIYRIMTPHDLPDDLEITFIDGNQRNLIFTNLWRV